LHPRRVSSGASGRRGGGHGPPNSTSLPACRIDYAPDRNRAMERIAALQRAGPVHDR
jgi:hypothetical protein